VTETTDLNTILREYLQDSLKRDLERRLDRPPGSPVYAHWWEPGDKQTAMEADLRAIRDARDSLKRDLTENDPKELADYAEELIQMHALSPELHAPLTYGLIEAAIRSWDVAERRTLGTEPLVFEAEAEVTTVGTPIGATKATSPAVSSLIDAFGNWGLQSGGWRPGAENQAKASLRLFIEICGDRPIDSFTRADGDKFRTKIRQLPAIYRKSAQDKLKPIHEIIAEAEAKGAPKITETTVKRHFWGLSRFFAFLLETGRLPRDAENLGRGFSFNTKGPARDKRDMWEKQELTALFASPVWTGCHGYFRSQAGDQIIRDSLFWLPLLGLYHGNRLEEFAQLRRADVAEIECVWFLDITDEDGRQLKNAQSRRKVPLHSELIRLGFLDYVAKTTAKAEDQVFPDLKPGGKDRKLGYYFSKKFSAYRKSIGVHRSGLDYHSFRHGVTTKLYRAKVTEGWIDLLTGHESGGESRRRYLKDIPLPQLKEAIDLVAWPEIDLSSLYTT
jgi:integrase